MFHCSKKLNSEAIETLWFWAKETELNPGYILLDIG